MANPRTPISQVCLSAETKTGSLRAAKGGCVKITERPTTKGLVVAPIDGWRPLPSAARPHDFTLHFVMAGPGGALPVHGINKQANAGEVFVMLP